jgi:MoxR-like ATPase
LEEKIGTIKIARQVEGARFYMEKLDLADAKLMAHRNNEDIKLSKADKKVLSGHNNQRQAIEEKIKEWMVAPEVYYEVNRRQMLDYHRQLLKGGIVETPSVKTEIGEILGHLQLGIPVFLRGHLGSGKSELCHHIARKYFKVEPEWIFGSEESSKYDMIAKTQMGQKPHEERIRDCQFHIKEYKSLFPEAKPEDLKKVEEEFYKEIVVNGKVVSFSQYGPLVRAMKEGKPVIIDEMDGIPHSILMRLNHILTRSAEKRGGRNTVTIQENGGEEIVIKKGFCVMATGNIKSDRYKREELDAAFLSRWWPPEIKYLPQDETLKILSASLIDKRGNLELNSPEDLDALKRLTQSAEEIQKIFTGEKTDVFGEGGDAARGVSASLEKSVLSMRDLQNIVKPWKAHNFDKPLDDYIYTEFIKKAIVPKDAVYLTQLFCRFEFFKDWEAEKFGISGLDKKKIEAFRAKKSK